MLGITDLPTFLIGTVVVILLPGPNSLFVLSVASRQGVADGYRAALGVLTCDAFLMSASVAGLAPLLNAHPALFTAIRVVGAAYLAWMGAGLIRQALRQWRDPAFAASAMAPPRVRHPFRRVIGIGLLNPKAIFFFISFFVQFVDPASAHPLLSFAVLGALMQSMTFCYLSALIFAGAQLARLVRSRRGLAAGASAGAGLLFIGFGARLAA